MPMGPSYPAVKSKLPNLQRQSHSGTWEGSANTHLRPY